MQLIGKERLLRLKGISTEVDIWTSAWVTEIGNASWISDLDLQSSFPKAVKLESTIFSFPVRSTKYHVKVIFCFKKSIVLISEVLTHE